MAKEYELGLVSVIIPSYNRANHVLETLNSVLEQTYRPIEIIVVDDGSTDKTKEILMNWDKKRGQGNDLELHYYRQKNQGGSAARNLGLIKSYGEFIQFLDSDDILAPKKIAEQIQVLSSSREKTAVYGQWRLFKKNVNGEYKVYNPRSSRQRGDDLHNWLSGWWFVPSHCLLWKRKDVFQLGPWDETLTADQDGEYSIRFLLGGGQLVLCPSAWCYYRQYQNPAKSIVGRKSRKSFESRYRVIERIEKALEAQDKLNEYREAISIRYAHLANRCALYCRDITNKCLRNSRRLSPTGRLPDIFTYPLLSRIIGLTLKQRIGYVIRTIFNIPIRNSSSQPKTPIATVKNAEQLCVIDEGVT